MSRISAIRAYWDARPCGTIDVPESLAGTREGFAALDHRRYTLEPCIESFARFADTRGLRVLEIGCGAGADLLRFAGAGARVTGIDLTPAAIRLTERRFATFGLQAEDLRVADAEALPYPSATFDLVWSWGVLHHTPSPDGAVREALRVLVPGGRARVMLYHRHSLFALQAWTRYALLRRQLRCSVHDVLARHVESPGTRAYTKGEAVMLFRAAGFVSVTARPVLTVWDARLGRRWFLPGWARALLPDRVGWFLLIEARRP